MFICLFLVTEITTPMPTPTPFIAVALTPTPAPSNGNILKFEKCF